jgi:hypothetical protein
MEPGNEVDESAGVRLQGCNEGTHGVKFSLPPNMAVVINGMAA